MNFQKMIKLMNKPSNIKYSSKEILRTLNEAQKSWYNMVIRRSINRYKKATRIL